MACKRCGSEAQKQLDAELTATLPNLKGLNTPPVYSADHILVCLDCGFTELTIAKPQLDRLRKAAAASGSPGER